MSTTLANDTIGGSAEDEFLENDDFDYFTFVSSLLVTGSNTLAVEIHQANPNSTDVTFDAEILVTIATQDSPPILLDDTTQVNSRTFERKVSEQRLGCVDSFTDGVKPIPARRASECFCRLG